MINAKDINNKLFDDNYLLNEDEMTRINVVLDMIGTGKSVLDLGCRDGTISMLIKEKGNEVECAEISDFNLQQIRDKGLVAYDLDLNTDWADKIEKKYDVVFAGEVIEHLFETETFVQNIYKVLKPGGFTVISTPNLASLGRRIVLLLGKNPHMEVTTKPHEAGHLRYFVRSTLEGLLEENNLQVSEFKSDIVYFSYDAKLKSVLLAKLMPTFGRSLIVKAFKR